MTQLKRYSVFIINPWEGIKVCAPSITVTFNTNDSFSSLSAYLIPRRLYLYIYIYIYIYLYVILVSHTFSTILFINLSNTERSLPVHSLAVSVLEHDHNEPISCTEKLRNSIPVTKSLLYKNYTADHSCLIGTTTLLLRCIPFRNSPSRSYLPLKKYILTHLW